MIQFDTQTDQEPKRMQTAIITAPPIDGEPGRIVSGEILPPFNYDALDQEQARRAHDAVAYIGQRRTSATTAVLEIGAKLNEVKADLGHGSFGNWLALEFGWSDRTARRYMDDAKALGTKTDTVADLPLTVVHELGRAAEPIREKVLAQIDQAKSEGRALPAQGVSNLLWQARTDERKARDDAKELAKKSPEQRKRMQAYRERQKRDYEIERAQQEAKMVIEKAADDVVANMIAAKFGNDLQALVEAMEVSQARYGRLFDRLQNIASGQRTEAHAGQF